MGKLAEKRVAIAKRILETEDEGLLNTMDELVNGRQFKLTAADIRDLDRISAKYKAGEGKTYTWPEVKKRLQASIAKAKR